MFSLRRTRVIPFPQKCVFLSQKLSHILFIISRVNKFKNHKEQCRFDSGSKSVLRGYIIIISSSKCHVSTRYSVILSTGKKVKLKKNNIVRQNDYSGVGRVSSGYGQKSKNVVAICIRFWCAKTRNERRKKIWFVPLFTHVEFTIEITGLFFIFYPLCVSVVVWDRFAKIKRKKRLPSTNKWSLKGTKPGNGLAVETTTYTEYTFSLSTHLQLEPAYVFAAIIVTHGNFIAADSTFLLIPRPRVWRESDIQLKWKISEIK